MRPIDFQRNTEVTAQPPEAPRPNVFQYPVLFPSDLSHKSSHLGLCHTPGLLTFSLLHQGGNHLKRLRALLKPPPAPERSSLKRVHLPSLPNAPIPKRFASLGNPPQGFSQPPAVAPSGYVACLVFPRPHSWLLSERVAITSFACLSFRFSLSKVHRFL